MATSIRARRATSMVSCSCRASQWTCQRWRRSPLRGSQRAGSRSEQVEGVVFQICPSPIQKYEPKRIPIDAPPDDKVRHLHGLGKTARLTGAPLHPGPPRPRLPLERLRVACAPLGLISLSMARVHAPSVRSDRTIISISILSQCASAQQDTSHEVWDHLLCQQAERVHHTLIGELTARVHVQRYAGNAQGLLIFLKAFHHGFRCAIGYPAQHVIITRLRKAPEPFKGFLVTGMMQRVAYHAPLPH